jgi:hypothetical protein
VTTIAGGSDLCPWFHGSTTSLTSSGPIAPAFLVDATAGARGCLDVVTLTFQTRGDGTAPGYVVGYRDLAKDPLREAPAPVVTDTTNQSDGAAQTEGTTEGDGKKECETPADTETPPETDPPPVIDVPGEAHLVVTVAPAASTDASTEGNPSTYPGNLSLEYGDHHHLVIVRELPDAKDAVGQETVNWVIGLDSVRPFRVDRATNPPRITILIG